jgi:superfamily II DNA or RNA helicase
MNAPLVQATDLVGTFDRHLVRPAMDRGGVTLRPWQRQCLIDQTAASPTDAGMVSAVMGAGKSIVIALLCAAWRGPVVVTTSTIKLVEQLSDEIRRLTGEPVGVYYTGGKSTSRITVTCLPSVERLSVVLGPTAGLLWLADEAHRCERDTVAAFIETCQPARRIGFSATPYRASAGLTIWTHEAYRYTLDDGIREGSLVPFRLVLWTEKLADELGVPYYKPRYNPDDDVKLNDADTAIRAWCRSQSGPGVISAANIADAEDFAAECMADGYRVQAVHSRMSKKAVKGAIERLRTGELSALVHCHMLSEGVDMPWLRWMALRQGRGSRVEFLQEFGRVLRAAPGKTEAVIFDPHAKSLDHPMTGWLEIEGDKADEPEVEAEPNPTEDPLTGEEFEWDDLPEKERKKIAARGAARAYLSTAIVALTASGLLDPIGYGVSQWRFNPASDRQTAFLSKFEKTARMSLTMRGYLTDGAVDDTQAAHVQAVALIIYRLCKGIEALAEKGRTYQSGVLSDACSLAKTLLWGFGKNDDDRRSKVQVRQDAFAALERYGIDPAEVLAGVR